MGGLPGGHAAASSPTAPSSRSLTTTRSSTRIYDLDDRFQVPGAQYLYSGRIYEKDGGEPHWRGIYDDHGRIMVAICFNMDLGDSWEWADVPQYPEKFSDLGLRIVSITRLRDDALSAPPLPFNPRYLPIAPQKIDNSSPDVL